MAEKLEFLKFMWKRNKALFPLVLVLVALFLGACASTKKQQREVLRLMKREAIKSHDASCEEIRGYIYRLEIGIDRALRDLE